MSKQTSSGFTIVELLIVIVVIGILASLVIVTFQGIQAKGRDAERQTDIKAVYGHIEAFYTQTGGYPTLAQINDTTWRSANVAGLDREAWRDPKTSSYNLAATPTNNQYSYEVTAANGSACDNSSVECGKYTLTARLERGSAFTKSNLD